MEDAGAPDPSIDPGGFGGGYDVSLDPGIGNPTGGPQGLGPNLSAEYSGVGNRVAREMAAAMGTYGKVADFERALKDLGLTGLSTLSSLLGLVNPAFGVFGQVARTALTGRAPNPADLLTGGFASKANTGVQALSALAGRLGAAPADHTLDNPGLGPGSPYGAPAPTSTMAMGMSDEMRRRMAMQALNTPPQGNPYTL
jgi:hypothetical protein